MHLPPNDTEIAQSCLNLGDLLKSRGRLEEAEPFLRRAMEINIAAIGEGSLEVAMDENQLGEVLRSLKRPEEAKNLYLKSIATRERLLGPKHPRVALVLNNLGVCLHGSGRYDEAEAVYLRALEIRREALGEENEDTLQSIAYEPDSLSFCDVRKYLTLPAPSPLITSNFAELQLDKGDFKKAEGLYMQVLAVNERVLGDSHPETVLLMRWFIFFKGFFLCIIAEENSQLTRPIYFFTQIILLGSSRKRATTPKKL